MLQHAAERAGTWEIKTAFDDLQRNWQKVFPRLSWALGYKNRVVIKCRFTEKEYARIHKTMLSQIHSASKPGIVEQLLANIAATEWPSGSVDDVVMRTVGVWVIAQYCMRNLKSNCDCIPCFAYTTTNSSLRRVDWVETESDVSPGTGVPTVVDLLDPTDPDINDMGYVKPGKSRAPHPCGSNVADAEIRGSADPLNERTIRLDLGVTAVIGQNTSEEQEKEIVGFVSLPISQCPNVYSNNGPNVEVAINERQRKKATKVTLTADDKQKIAAYVAATLQGGKNALYSFERVKEWYSTHLLLDLKSKKWTEKRFETAWEKVLGAVDPEFKFSTAVKLEPMPEGKAPRFLIADGDEGQVLALMVISCMEWCYKSHYVNGTIKGKSKSDAMDMIPNILQPPAALIAKGGWTSKEGDGSAWDTTCSKLIRDLCEKPIIEHIAAILKSIMHEPEQWTDVYANTTTLKTFVLKHKQKIKDLSFYENSVVKKWRIPAQRRSGERGTWILNTWTNRALWTCAVWQDPAKFLDPTKRNGIDSIGASRWWNGIFEGDDSAMSMSPAITDGDAFCVHTTQFWERAGFHMKLIFNGDNLLFTGYRFAKNEKGFNGFATPEIDRCFGRSGVSCSGTGVSAIKDYMNGDRMFAPKKLKAISKAAALSRAYEFAGRVPTISRKYLEYYNSLEGATSVSEQDDRDFAMKVCGDNVDVDILDLVQQITTKNDEYLNDEIGFLKAVGYPASQAELDQFVRYPWSLDVFGRYEDFHDNLPASWRT